MAIATANIVVTASNSLALEDRVIMLEEACILLQARVAGLQADLIEYLIVEDIQPLYDEADRQIILE